MNHIDKLIGNSFRAAASEAFIGQGCCKNLADGFCIIPAIRACCFLSFVV